MPAAKPRRRDLAPRRQRSQRERERERRVSDADASYNGPANNTRTLNNAIPQRKHAKNNPLSKNDPVPLPRALPKPVRSQTTEAKPNPTLFRPKPPYWRPHPTPG